MIFRPLIIATTLATSPLVTAKTTSEPDTSLDTLFVTATRTQIPVRDALAPVEVIDRSEIERSQADSLQDLLRGRAGINLTNSGGSGKQTSLFLRGTNSAHTLVLLDGVRINTADFGQAMLQDLPLAQIERIEIVRGPQSSLYGADAIGGVIQIFTRRNTGRMASHAQLGGGSHHLREVSAGIGGGDVRGWFGIDAALQHTDGIDACRGSITPFAGCGAQDPDRDGYRNRSLSLRGGWRVSDALTLEGAALRADGDTHYDGFYDFSDTRQQVVSTTLRYTPGPRLALTLDAGRADNRSDNYGGGLLLGRADTRRDSASMQVDIGLTDGHLLTTGLDWSEDALDGSTAGYTVNRRDNTGVFAQYQGRLGAHAFQASLRRDDNQQFGQHSTGAVAWGVNFGPGLTLTARHGTAFKAPTFSDLYDPWSGVSTLKPERARSQNLGLAQHGANWHWRLDVYQTRIDDLITYDASSFQMSQVERARIHGAELTTRILMAGWTLHSQMSHTAPHNRTRGSAQFDNWLPRRARNTARLALDRPFGQLRLGLGLYTASQRFDDAANIVSVGGHAITDVRLEYAITREWTVLVRVSNLFDQNYETVAWYNQPGREYRLALRWNPSSH